MSDFKHSSDSSDDVFSELDQEPEFSFSDYRIEDWLVLVVFTVLAVTVFSQFFSRYVLGSSLGWTEEVARYLLVCLGFLGGAMAVRKSTHIGVEFFVRMMPDRLARFCRVFVALFSTVFLAALLMFSVQIIPRIHIYEMASLPLSLSALYGVVAISIAMMLFRSVKCLISLRKA